jgi:glycosyltransferase involved in cell wall biosynthesis
MPVGVARGARVTPSVSVIIPTMAAAERACELDRALRSVEAQRGVVAVPIVVVNGQRRDPRIVERLRGSRQLKLVEQEEGVAPKAVAAGRRSVDTEYFCVLDDDDELLPDGLAIKARSLAADPAIDVVVTGGFRRVDDQEEACLPNIEACQPDPLGALMEGNWLASCAALFRTSSFGPETFARLPRYLEWTYLAHVLAIEKRILFKNDPTFRIHAHSARSLSMSRDYVLYQPVMLGMLQKLALPGPMRRVLRRKYRATLHSVSDFELQRRHLRSAWVHHLRSLAGLAGLRYLPYTRRLLVDSLRTWLPR